MTSEVTLSELDREAFEFVEDDGDVETVEKPLQFSPEVEKAIASILPDDDPFSRPDFDVTDYVNQLFPTEQSLGNIDEVMTRIKMDIQEIDTEIADIVQCQSAASVDGQQAVLDAKIAIQELFTRIREIKTKTDMSESMVKEITRDIKQLDHAKKNLTASITTLNHLHMLLSGVEELQSSTKTKQYGQIANLLPGIMNVLEHFDRYLGIPQIKELSDQVQQVRKELATQVVVDFKEHLTSSSSSVLNKSAANSQHTLDVCRVVSVLDKNIKNELIVWFLQQQLAEYLVLFEDTQDSAWLDKLDERYTWFRNKLMEFEDKYQNIFPPDWSMPRRFAVEFCNVTRSMLEKLIQKRVNEIDVKLLLYAIQRSSNFENLLCKRFPFVQQPVQTATDVAPTNKNTFQGILTQLFDPHLNIFIIAQDRNLNTLLDQFASKFRDTGGQPKLQTETTAVTISSSGDLFMVYKKCIQQLSQVATTDKPLVDLAQVFKKYLREYAHRCMTAFLPKINSAQITSTAGLIQSLLKEGEVARLTNDEIFLTCCILTTAEFCAETTQQLQEKLKEKVADVSLHPKLDMGPEQDVFHNVITSCIQVLVQNLEGACEPALQAMTKMPWSSVENVGDESRYVSNVKTHIRSNVPKIRDYLTNARKYFVQFCLKFASSFILKFLNCLFRCKPLNPSNLAGAEQLLLDTVSLKTELLNMPNVESVAARKPPAAYTKVVMKGMTKAEMILKVVMVELTPTETFVEQYLRLLPDSDVLELQKILEMKFVRRLDQTPIIELYRSKIEGVSSSIGNLLSPSSMNVNASSLSIDAESTIKKLEKLVKKRL